MKKLILILTLFSFSFIQAQVFYGMTIGGGRHDYGAIISFNPTTNSEDTVHSFGSLPDGQYPARDLVYDAGNGLFYGMTGGGGIGYGAIISFNPLTNAEASVWSFGSGDDGGNPIGALVYDAGNGLFYGMTYGGGSPGYGAIISFNPMTNAEDTVHGFGRGDDGRSPEGDLVYDAANGLFYGMTQEGGSLNVGTIISFNPSTNVEDTIHSFGRGTDGENAKGSLVYDAGNGLFYGMTSAGGKFGDGAIISLNPTTNAEDTIYSFGRTSYDGQSPQRGDLVYYASTGLFYGMTQEGGSLGDGTIFSFNPLTNGEDTVHSFGRGVDGRSPEGDLVYDAGNGLFYGMTEWGGSFGDSGAIISFNPNTNAEVTVHSFGRGDDGYQPEGDLVLYPASTGIDEVKNSFSCNVFPNPNNGKFEIQVKSEEVRAKSEVEIYNMMGQKIYNETLNQVQGDNTIDISNQPNGIYLYRILKADGELIGSGKLMIQK